MSQSFLAAAATRTRACDASGTAVHEAVELAIQIACSAGYLEAGDVLRLEQVCHAFGAEQAQALWAELCHHIWAIPTNAHVIFRDGANVVWKRRYQQALSWDGRLYASGLQASFPNSATQFCDPDNQHPMEQFPNLRFSSAACGELHFIAIAGDTPEASSHRLFAWGHYRLTRDDLDAGAPPTSIANGLACRAPCGGLPSRGPVDMEPRRVQYTMGDRMPDTAVTRTGRSAVVHAGALRIFGASRFGLGDDAGHDDDETVWIEDSSPRIVAMPGLGRVTSISLGDEHALISDDGGRLFSFGDGGDGRLGLGQPLRTVRTLAQVTALAGKRVAGVAAGHAHSLVFLDDGSLWAFGSNSRGQLGQPAAGDWAATPVRVDGALAVTQVAAGLNLSAALTSAGSLLTFGQGNEHGLGTDERIDCDTPTIVLPERRIVSVAVGVGYMVAIDDEGRAFSWGYNSHNQCGRGHDEEDADEMDDEFCPDGCVRVGQVHLPGPVRFVSACWATFYVLGLQRRQ